MARTPLLFCALALSLAAQPARLPEHPESQAGPAALRTYAEVPYFHLRTRTTQRELPARMEALVPRLHKALAAAGTASPGPLLLVYRDLAPDPEQPFELEVGLPVSEGTRATGECQVRRLPAFTCAAATYSGRFDRLGAAYSSLYAALVESGRTPSAEMRQMVLYWEGAASLNNMLLLQVGTR